MTLRASSNHTRRQLKLATQRTVQHCGGQDSAASITRVGRATLSDYANTGNSRHADTFMPVDVLADLILDCKARGEVPPLLTSLCELAGGSFVHVPEPDRDTSSQQLELSAINRRLWKFSELVARHLQGDLSAADFAGEALPQALGIMNDMAQLKQQSLKVQSEEGC